MTLLATVFIIAAVFFATLVGAQIFARAVSEYKTRYGVQTVDDALDMLLFVQPRQLRFLSVILALCGFFSSLWFGPIAGTLMGVALALAPTLLVNRHRAQRIEKFEQQLAEAMLTIASALRSGLTFRQAMAEVANHAPSPLGQEFKVFGRELQLGTPLDDALEHMASRVGSNELDLFVSASQIAIKVGGNIAETFDKLAGTLRERFRLEGRIRALTAQGKLQGIVIGLMPLIVWMGFDYFRPDLTRPMLDHWFGYLLIITIVTMITCGALVIRRIIRIEV